MSELTLTDEQQECHDNIVTWVEDGNHGKNPEDFTSLAGLAGTGKTTLLGILADNLHKNFNMKIAFVTFTGKASQVLASKMKGVLNLASDHIGTIHSLIYTPIVNSKGEIEGWGMKDNIDFDVIIVDEGSMVGKNIWQDLCSYGVPIIVMGDHGQLPPVGEATFNLLEDPDQILVEIHRQAKDNPIIQLAYKAREGGYIDFGTYGKGCAKLHRSDNKTESIINNFGNNDKSVILCGMNNTRVQFNKQIRANGNLTRHQPYPGEKIICLKNNKNLGIMNGQTGILQDLKMKTEEHYIIKVLMDGFDKPVTSLCTSKAFNKIKYDDAYKESYLPDSKNMAKSNGFDMIDMFDFGYCLSVHKSQGSEFDRVLLMEERNYYQSDLDFSRWLYTGITRASKKLLIVEE